MDEKTNQGTTPTGVESQPAAPAAPEPQAPAQPVAPEPTPAPVAPKEPEQDARSKEQFNKLLESNRRLFEANELLRQEMQRKAQVNQTFNPVQQQPQPTQVPTDNFYEVDPDTGETIVKADKLQAKIDDLNSRATRAEQSVQNYIKQTEEKESIRQNQETFAAYPELNPANQINGTFDEEFHKQTRALIYDSLINPQDYGGKPLQFKEAADRAKSRGVSTNIMTQSEGATGQSVQPTTVATTTTPAPESADQKEQGSLQATAQPSTQATNSINQEADLEELRRKTRMGNSEESKIAIAQRLARIDHVGTPTHGTE